MVLNEDLLHNVEVVFGACKDWYIGKMRASLSRCFWLW